MARLVFVWIGHNFAHNSTLRCWKVTYKASCLFLHTMHIDKINQHTLFLKSRHHRNVRNVRPQFDHPRRIPRIFQMSIHMLYMHHLPIRCHDGSHFQSVIQYNLCVSENNSSTIPPQSDFLASHSNGETCFCLNWCTNFHEICVPISHAKVVVMWEN